jgi:signal transduction histidine kinase
MVNKMTSYPEQQPTKIIGLPENFLKRPGSHYVLLAILVGIYILVFPLLHTWIGTAAGMFVSIPVVAFAYNRGLRHGLLSWFSLGIVTNTILLNLSGLESGKGIFTQGEIVGQAVLLLVTVMIGRMRDLANHSLQQAEHRTQSHLTELVDTNQALNSQITEYKLLNAQLQSDLDKQRQLTEFKSRLRLMTSHEFRTPLSIILNSSEILRNFSSQLTEDQKQRYFDMIQGHVDQLMILLDDLMALGKAELATPHPASSLLDIEQFCQEIVSTFQAAHSSTHTIGFRSEGMFREVHADRKFMQQVVTNLLSNAVKYSPSGGEISLDLSCQENEFVIQVQDQGIGIAEEDLNHLFDLFYRGNNADVAPGTGLGLVIVKQAVEMQGGTIQVDSKLGSGTTFTVCIPHFPKTKLTE